jgi:hypothetical protein
MCQGVEQLAMFEFGAHARGVRVGSRARDGQGTHRVLG